MIFIIIQGFDYPQHPLEFEFLGSKGPCDFEHPESTFFQSIAYVPRATTADPLHARVSLRLSIQCLALTVYSMNRGNSVAIGRITGYHSPFYTQQKELTLRWSGPAPRFYGFCTGERDFEYIYADTCESRTDYIFQRGIGLCQCDAHCQEFGDCCTKFKGSVAERMAKQAKLSRKSTHILECSSTQFPNDQLVDFGFFLVTSCTQEFIGTDLEQNCKRHGITASIPFQFGEVVYKNIFCALCNNETVKLSHAWSLAVHNDSRACGKGIEAELLRIIRDETDGRAFDQGECGRMRGYAYPLLIDYHIGEWRTF